MSIELTEHQQQLVDRQGDAPPRLVDPRTNATYVLVPAEEYDSLREILEEERRRKAVHAIALRNAAGRMNEPA